MVIKVCGTREPGNIRELVALAPGMIGFIFYPGSKRYARYLDKQITRDIPGNIHKVGVFVNQHLDEIEKISASYLLDFLQLHGNESPEFCEVLKKKGHKIIKVFGIAKPGDFNDVALYENHADLFLFDTKSPNHGGTGQKFRWDLLRYYTLKKPYILSGGISSLDIDILKEAEAKYKPWGVDINSRFEISPGIKDIEKTRKFIDALKEI